MAFAALALVSALSAHAQTPPPVPEPSSSASATPRALTLEEHMALRCATAFAMVSAAQARGDAAALRYPPLGERGREFFVLTAAQLMDDAGLDEAGIHAAVSAEAAKLRNEGTDQIMPLCLEQLDLNLPAKR